MPLKADILGMVHEYPDYFEVGRENVRQFACDVRVELGDVFAAQHHVDGKLGAGDEFIA